MNQSATETIGIMLLNLGGPDSLKAVKPFLYNLFSDRDIIRLGPAFLQKPLARLISSVRGKKTEGYYGLIGGKSPILDITTAQAKALEEDLNSGKYGPRSFRVFIGMRYWRPFTEDAVRHILAGGIGRVVALSLYPQYSVATTGSSLMKLKQVISGKPLETHVIDSWYDHAGYIDSLVDNIREGMALFGQGKGSCHVLFSAHSLPVKFIEEGDPYVEQTMGTIRAVTGKLDMEWDLSYQSKSGPVKWLEPSTDEMIERLAARGVRDLLVVPISFVSDHIETLYEIDILYKRMAGERGMRLERCRSLNTSERFIQALSDIVLKGTEQAAWNA